MELKFKCPRCGEENELRVDMKLDVSYVASFDEYESIDLQQTPDTGDLEDFDNSEGYWYCGSCLRHIFTGTKSEMEEFLASGMPSDEEDL